jgi:hypothetical protein
LQERKLPKSSNGVCLFSLNAKHGRGFYGKIKQNQAKSFNTNKSCKAIERSILTSQGLQRDVESFDGADIKMTDKKKTEHKQNCKGGLR